MGGRGPALELGVELTAQEVRVPLQLDDLDQLLVGRGAREHEPRRRELLLVLVGELVAVPMALGDVDHAVRVGRHAARQERAREGAEAHRRPLVPEVPLLGEQVDDRMGRVAVELGGVGAREPGHVARELDDRQLHAEADPEEGDHVLARVADRHDLPLGPAIAEPARDEHGVEVGEELLGPLLLDGSESMYSRSTLQSFEAGVHERLVERLVGVAQVHVLADDADLHRPLAGLLEPVAHAATRKVRLAAPDVEAVADEVVEPLRVEVERYLVDARDVDGRDDRLDRDVREERDLPLRLVVERVFVRQMRMSGWMPMLSISFTECCVGFVFSSPAVSM